jgi:RNA methyltransferase, TrmH family
MTIAKSKLKEIRELTHKKHRDEQKKFLVEGVRLLQEAVASDFKVLEVYYTSDLKQHPSGKPLLQTLQKKTSEVHQVSTREMEIISETVTFQGIVAVVMQKQFSADSLLQKDHAQSIIVAFDGVSDPGNAGSMVRTCDWFGVGGILLGRNSVELYNPKVVRATMGGVFHLPIAEDVDILSAISKAKTLGYKIYITDPRGETHFDRVKFERKSLVVFGNEAWGVSDQVKQLADIRLSIRRYGAADSLNVGVACGVILSALHRLYDE